MKAHKSLVKNKIEINLNEISDVENIITDVLEQDNFLNLDYELETETEQFGLFNPIFEEEEDITFITVNKDALKPYVNSITEKEFFKIVGITKKGLSARSGRYQESLYGHYIQAVAENDAGYISDVLNKAIKFENNMKIVRSLSKNKTFMKEWRKDFGKESPLNILKHYGNLNLINIVKERLL